MSTGGEALARLSKGFQVGSFRLTPQIQANWISNDLGNYEFGVPLDAATPLRPAYDVHGSTSYEVGLSSFIELTEDWRIVLDIAAEFLPEEITNSPIVADDRVVKGFAAITYVF